MAAGLILSKALVRAGLYISTTSEYPSLIRGGHNVYIIRASEEEIFSLVKPVELLIVLNHETLELHKDELSKGAAVIYDSDDQTIKTEILDKNKIKLFPVPLLKLATQNGGKKLMMNNVAIASAWSVTGLPFEILESVIMDNFTNKSQEIIDENLTVARSGYDYVKTNLANLANDLQYRLKKGKAPKRLVLTGNEALGLGAIKADLGFAALYPMTPINGLLTYLAGHQEKTGFIFQQPEDEIAGINMAIGASYAGKRSLVASSGGGFSLMVEGLGMAGMTEIPLVVVVGTRPGPSSGLATWTGQGDLKFILSASQGEFLRVVLAPGDPRECFEMIQTAFNLADKYQTPVLLLVDKYLCESIGTMEKSIIHHCVELATKQSQRLPRPADSGARNDGNYKRYQITESGISPRALPGETFFITNSYEHDEFGYSTENAEIIKAMTEKRGRKYAVLAKEAPEPVVYGDPSAEITLVGWGSTKGACREAVESRKYQVESKTINYLHLNWINPFPKEAVKRILAKARKVIDVEGNFSGQMAGWIREQTGLEIKDKILKYDGRPFYAEDILEGVKKYA